MFDKNNNQAITTIPHSIQEIIDVATQKVSCFFLAPQQNSYLLGAKVGMVNCLWGGFWTLQNNRKRGEFQKNVGGINLFSEVFKRGMKKTVATGILTHSIQFGLTHQLNTLFASIQQEINRRNNTNETSIMTVGKMMAPVVAGSVSAIPHVWWENWQVEQLKFLEQESRKLSPNFTTLTYRDIYRNGGYRSLLAGDKATMIRLGLGTTCFHTVAPYLNENIQKMIDSPMTAIIFGSILSGVFGAVVSHAPDGIRVYQQKTDKQASMCTSAVKIIEKDGMRKLLTFSLGNRIILVGGLIAVSALIKELSKQEPHEQYDEFFRSDISKSPRNI